MRIIPLISSVVVVNAVTVYTTVFIAEIMVAIGLPRGRVKGLYFAVFFSILGVLAAAGTGKKLCDRLQHCIRTTGKQRPYLGAVILATVLILWYVVAPSLQAQITTIQRIASTPAGHALIDGVSTGRLDLLTVACACVAQRDSRIIGDTIAKTRYRVLDLSKWIAFFSVAVAITRQLMRADKLFYGIMIISIVFPIMALVRNYNDIAHGGGLGLFFMLTNLSAWCVCAATAYRAFAHEDSDKVFTVAGVALAVKPQAEGEHPASIFPELTEACMQELHDASLDCSEGSRGRAACPGYEKDALKREREWRFVYAPLSTLLAAVTEPATHWVHRIAAIVRTIL